MLYDEDYCDTSSDMLRVREGEEGRLAKWAPFTSTLQRNDLESLIVRDHCKLELWDDDDGIDNRQPPDIVIDNTVRDKKSSASLSQSMICLALSCGQVY